MKMKEKKSQRFTASINEYSKLCSHITYVLLLSICLIESSLHVDAYISGATHNVTDNFQHFNMHTFNVSRRFGASDRIGRFLFDSFFGIETPPLDASDFDDVEDDDDDEPSKPCKCGK